MKLYRPSRRVFWFVFILLWAAIIAAFFVQSTVTTAVTYVLVVPYVYVLVTRWNDPPESESK